MLYVIITDPETAADYVLIGFQGISDAAKAIGDFMTFAGTIGLIKAIDRFDCDRGVEFPTFAMPTVVGEIKRFFRDTSWSVRVPRRLQELRLALTKASDELSQKLDRSPTVSELAAVLGVSEEDVVDGLAVGNAYTASSLDSPAPEDDGGEGSLADRLGYEDTALEGVEYRESLKPLLAKLPPRERRIIMLRFFANMTQSQIGEEVGISQMHVSRLLTRTLAQLGGAHLGLTSAGFLRAEALGPSRGRGPPRVCGEQDPVPV
ncbi:RNA polymerase sigma factor SigF [Streptomyces griseoloalbus]